MNKDRSPNPEAEIDRIKKKLKGLIDGKWSAGEETYYLSQLGNDLGDDDRTAIERLTKLKLRQFLTEEFDYAIKSTGRNNNVYYLAASPSVVAAPSSTPRYSPRFWAAFAKPLNGAPARHINIKTCEFGPDREALGSGDQVREISSKYITPDNQSRTQQDIIDSICRWLQEQALEPSSFLFRKEHVARKGYSVLDVMLDTLSVDQLRRVSLPLDIIRSLNNRSAR